MVTEAEGASLHSAPIGSVRTPRELDVANSKMAILHVVRLQKHVVGAELHPCS